MLKDSLREKRGTEETGNISEQLSIARWEKRCLQAHFK